MKKRFLQKLCTMLAVALVAMFAACDNGTTGGGGGTPVPGNNLAEKLAWLVENAESGGDYLIELNADESTTTIVIGGGSDMDWYRANYSRSISLGDVLVDFGNRTDITVTLRGQGGNRGISLSPNRVGGSLFFVLGGVTLVLDNNITLKRRAGHEGRMVEVSSGTFVMNSGSAIDNTNDAVGHGGVHGSGTFIMNGGTIFGGGGYGVQGGYGALMERTGVFTMNGGTIKGIRGWGVSVSGVFTMNGGTITGISGIGVWVRDAGTFTMSGGTISGNTGELGGGVRSQGTFTMSGGLISGNTAELGGGVAGGLTMSGGTISGNSARRGGGVSLFVNMSGGTISGNTAELGGGVFGTLTMSGGLISGNTAKLGGGVLAFNLTKTGGTITGSDTRGGNVATQSDGGNAVGIFVESREWTSVEITNVKQRKETTSGPSDNLSHNGDTGEFTGAWDN